MLFVIAFIVALAAGLAARGKLRNLAAMELRWPLVVVAALAVKLAGVTWPLAFLDITPAIYMLSLFALSAWALFHAQSMPGMWLLAAGMGLNLVCVVVNGGHMPTYRGSAQLMHYLSQRPIGQYALADSHTQLGFLGDWIGIPGPLGSVFAEGYSPGDLLAITGLMIVIFMAMRRPAVSVP
jgi:hypothetical protein